MKMLNNTKKNNEGFTIIEIMVASSLFLTIMLMMSGSILSIFDSNQKSKNIRSVMDNLNLSFESMTRTIRFGTNYHCGSSGDPAQPQDCTIANSTFSVLSSEGDLVTFSLSSGRIRRTVNGVSSFITSPDVTITRLLYWVSGSDIYPDFEQPLVTIVVSGYVGNDVQTRSTFSLQTSISQRTLDFQ